MEPIPGRKLHNGETKTLAKIVLKFFLENGFEISCFGISTFFEMLVISVEQPNNPVNKGRSGC